MLFRLINQVLLTLVLSTSLQLLAEEKNTLVIQEQQELQPMQTIDADATLPENYAQSVIFICL